MIGYPTVNDIVKFVLDNRHGKAFCGWTVKDIFGAVLEGIEDRTITYSLGEDGLLNGICHGHKNDGVIYIYNILATEKGAMQKMIAWFLKMYPGCSAEARRHNKRKVYNMQLLRKRILSYGR